MARAISNQEPTHASAFFEAMNFADDASMGAELLIDYHANNSTNPFRAPYKSNDANDHLLSDNHVEKFSLHANFWDTSSPLEFLQTNDPILSTLSGNHRLDTRYVARGGSLHERSATDQANSRHVLVEQYSKTSKARKRSSTKSTAANYAKMTPARIVSRTSKASSSSALMGGQANDSKHVQFLARNRAAAFRCRQKKKEWTQDLEQKFRDLASQKEMLTTALAMVKNELFMLKCKYLEHAACGCVGIRSLLENSTNTILSANPALYSELESKMSESGLTAEIARKQSSASCFDINAMPIPEDATAILSSAADNAKALVMHSEVELQARVMN